MQQRLISTAVMVPLVLVVFLLGQPWLTLGLAVVAGLAASEAGRLLRAATLPVERAVVIVAPPIAVLAMGWGGAPDGAAITFVAGVIVLAGMVAFREPDVRDGFLAWAGTAFGALYVSLLAFAAGILAIAPPTPDSAPLHGVLDAGRDWLLVLLVTVWSFDTFAYVCGRTFKRGRFLNHISPHKTWSGVIGGTVAAVIVGGVLTWAAGGGPMGGLVLGFVIAVTAQSGDVAESMLKRTAGAKDSGTLIPGHGGVLDRIDSFLFAAPAVFGYLVIVGHVGTTI
ncbi:MAG: phosphatidate cytidylyltransferase [Chloroflexi bacterium]|nr:phosphatidate cytidylyltransferase [Chloroflexota bacterium]